MKTLRLLCSLFLALFILSGCSNDYYRSQVSYNLLNETWMRQINLDPHRWAQQQGDRWFLTGEPNHIERYDQRAPISQAISTTAVRVSDFTNILVDGRFQVQIIGRQDHNSVYILGPNDQVRQLIVEVRDHTLCVRQVEKPACPTDKVIVRIGVKDLNRLINRGPGSIEGRDIISSGLIIKSTGRGKIILDGNMNLMRVIQNGSGTVTVIGAETRALDIQVVGNGCVNVSGRVGIRSILHAGNGEVNIIGADSNCLNITASCAGLTTVAGYVNLQKVNALDNSRVYVYWVNSNGTYVYARNNARIGLAGATQNLNIELAESTRFEGKSLQGENVYVRTRQKSHANVNANKKLFASASDRSSIYFYGSPSVLSRYYTDMGAVIPVWDESTKVPPLVMARPRVYAQPSLKGEYGYSRRMYK